jgi:hypothetical protein
MRTAEASGARAWFEMQRRSRMDTASRKVGTMRLNDTGSVTLDWYRDERLAGVGIVRH